ncbi:hypothetical protein OROGR_011802 [Orobanche gracilis]
MSRKLVKLRFFESKMKRQRKRMMESKKQDLFGRLPLDMMIDIFSRLPLRSIPISKCVCKPWLDLLSSHEFVDSYSPKLSTALVVVTLLEDSDSAECEVFESSEGEEFELYPVYETETETETETDSESEDEDEPLTRFEIPHMVRIGDSVNGLVFLSGRNPTGFDDLFVCNPITREYCHLEPLPERFFYGIGAGRVTGELKVVGIRPHNPVCDVYTLGTGSWRCVPIPALDYESFENENGYEKTIYDFDFGSFIDGNIYWLTHGNVVSCFDVETECFSTLSIPRMRKIPWGESDSDVVTKQEFRAIRIYKAGDKSVYYPDKTTNTRVADQLYRRRNSGGRYDEASKMLLTPIFVSLKTLVGMENVISF